jgi:hypothetical protein
MLQFRGSAITSDAGLLPSRELDAGIRGMSFEISVQRERARLHGEREAILLRSRNWKTSSPMSIASPRRSTRTKRPRAGKRLPHWRGRSVPRSRRGSKRDAILQLVKKNGTGLSRGEILEKMGLKGDKAGEMSVSNAFTALTKGGQVRRAQIESMWWRNAGDLKLRKAPCGR